MVPSSRRRASPWIFPALLIAACLAFAPASASDRRASAATYDLRWGVLPVAQGHLFVRPEDTAVEAWLDVRSSPAIRWIYDLTYRGEARLDKGLAPRTSRFVRTRNKRTKIVAMDFTGSGVDVEERKTRPGREEKVRTEHLPSEPGLLDPFALLLQLRAEAWQPGVERHYLVQSGRDRWRVTLRCRGREELAWRGGRREVWVLEADAEEHLAEPEPAEEKDAEAPWIAEVLAFVSADAAGELLELRVVTRVGKVRARLREQALSSTASG
jgi:hypothetical protein